MEKSQWYVGAPNGVVLCVDRMKEGHPCGRLYHSYSREALPFSNMDEMLFGMEQLYDFLRFPYPATNTRTFTAGRQEKTASGKERTKLMKDRELLGVQGDLGTFIVRVQHRQNSSWQGRITWMEEDRTLCFRSIWEMVKLIASAVETAGRDEDGEKEPSWFEEPKVGP